MYIDIFIAFGINSVPKLYANLKHVVRTPRACCSNTKNEIRTPRTCCPNTPNILFQHAPCGEDASRVALPCTESWRTPKNVFVGANTWKMFLGANN